MTEGELKFALQVEMVLNKIPQPEYRQVGVVKLYSALDELQKLNHHGEYSKFSHEIWGGGWQSELDLSHPAGL